MMIWIIFGSWLVNQWQEERLDRVSHGHGDAMVMNPATFVAPTRLYLVCRRQLSREKDRRVHRTFLFQI
jgi:hypothetical protein